VKLLTDPPVTPGQIASAAAPAQDQRIVPLGQKRFSIAGDTVRKAVTDLPEADREAIVWFHGWCARNIHGRTGLDRTLKKPDGGFYSADSIVQLFTGGRMRRGENIEPLIAAIATFRKIEGERETMVTSGFVETDLFLEIERRCLKALKRQRILPIYGDSQIGKSKSLREVQRRHNHGQTLYVEVPDTGSYGALLEAIADELNIPTASNNQRQLKRRIVEAIDGNMLVILDEAHRFFGGNKRSSGLLALSFVRELWNKSQCGLVLSMTNEGRDEILKGRWAKQLQQIWRRRITPLQLPSIPPARDLDKFAQAYGLDPATAEDFTVKLVGIEGKEYRHTDSPLRLQNEVVAAEGLGVWISILQDACDIAQEQRRKVTWGAVLKAHAQSQADAEIYQ
jgi:hypothetical protein